MGNAFSDPRPEVEVATGRLRGKTQTSRAGTKYHAFLGVPYAKPPVGELRFKAPQPAEPWAGVRDATVEGNPCLQPPMELAAPEGLSLKHLIGVVKHLPQFLHRFMVLRKQSEDCLFLNVFTPASTFAKAAASEGEGQDGTKKPLRPVLFWIHGGAFKLGDGNPDLYNPELFIDKDILLVTMNYRLGPLGFLSLGTSDVPGNAGLKDQAMALRWTRDNIKAFGGDPDAITVYGESAGGASSHLISLSPLCRGMFRGTIASSGNALTHWATTDSGLRVARALAKELGLQAESPAELADALRSVSAAKLTAAANSMTPVCDTIADQLMFVPVVEVPHDGAFLAEDPLAVVRSGKSSPTPLLAGVNSAEGLVWALFAFDKPETEVYRELNERAHFLLPLDLFRPLSPEQRDQCVKEIVQEYAGGKPFSRANVADFIELHGDLMFLNRTLVLCHLHAVAATSPVYLYRFDFVGKYNYLKAMCKARLGGDVKIPGAAHGDDLWYLSNVGFLPTLSSESRENVCRRRLVQLWANFIETGNPTPPGTDTDSDLIPVQWTPCSSTSLNYLNIGDSLELRSDKVFPKQAFWEGLYERYLGKPMLDGP